MPTEIGKVSCQMHRRRLIFSEEIFAGLHYYKRMVSEFASNLNYKAKIINNADSKKTKNESIKQLLREQ